MTISLRFHGAAGTVTGSCYLLQSASTRILIDCGLFQGSKTLKQLNYGPFPFEVRDIDAVLLTHAHIDHSGLLPKLVVAGFDGPIYATPGTGDLLGCMLPDSAHIQESDVANLNRRNKRRGDRLIEPIYTLPDAMRTLELLNDVAYNIWTEVAPGTRARWWNAGHLLGSASIEVEITEAGNTPLRILFSGDIGPDHKTLEDGPEGPPGFDYVLCEATYGDRDRIEVLETARKQILAAEVNAARKAGGALLIPSFAVERTQELIADLVALMDGGSVPAVPIFVDSPLASKATAVFRKHAHELPNGEALSKALVSPHLHVTESVEESKSLARMRGFHIIIAASGMCDAGRIRHHLKNWLPDRQATVLMVGHQATGTLGRDLLDGVGRVRIQGDEVAVLARIRMIESYSGHADAPELLAWLKARGPIREGLFLVHGEPAAIDGLKQAVTASGLLPPDRVLAPAMDDVVLLGHGAIELKSSATDRRIEPRAVVAPDWNHDLSSLLLDINSAVEGKADDKARQVIIRRLRRALEEQ
jgi:metallo-beta-lactamase family protein